MQQSRPCPTPYQTCLGEYFNTDELKTTQSKFANKNIFTRKKCLHNLGYLKNILDFRKKCK